MARDSERPVKPGGQIGMIEWIDYRLPIFTLLRHELREYPTPRNLTYLWNFGSLAGIGPRVRGGSYDSQKGDGKGQDVLARRRRQDSG